MRFAIQTPQYTTDVSGLASVWRAAEQLGFRSAWLMDHLYPIVAPPTEPILEAWSLLAALAAQTERIRIGVLVSANTFRHPAVLARIAATVDHVSRGRLEVGLGAAWSESEHVENGLPFPALGDRITALDEACRVLRGLWTEPVLTFAGKHYRLENARCEPKPVQARLPLLLGGQGERRMLRLVARHADRWNASGSAEALAKKVAVLHAHCAAIGRDPGEIGLTVRNDLLLTDDAAAARTEVERWARFMRVEPAEAKKRLWIGDRDEVAEGIAAFAEAGFDECILALRPPFGAATIEMLETFAAGVAPRFA